METFSLYLLKSVTSISILYCFYWFVLRNETYYIWNRYFLLVSLIVSLVLSMIKFPVESIPSETVVNILSPVIINSYLPSGEHKLSFDKLSILSIIYISGAVVLCIRFLSSLVKIYYLYLRFPKYNFNGFKAVVLDNDSSPFTFFNILFIPRTDFESGKIDEMIVHEKAHKDEFHTVDILLLELITIFQWFNPFVWMFRRALKSEHEFIADRRVLNQGYDSVNYQKLLFEKSMGVSTLCLINNFNYSLLKKRLKMMTINKSSSYAKIKYIFAIPVFLAITSLVITVDSFGQKGKIYEEVDVMAEYKGGDIENVRQYIKENITYPESARDKNVSARIYVQFVVDETGKVKDVHITRSDILGETAEEVVVKGYTTGKHPEIDPTSVKEIENEAIRVIESLSGFTPALKDGKKVSTQYTFPINFVLEEKKS
jgi:hypothetical protein